jgi:hypothetical protein
MSIYDCSRLTQKLKYDTATATLFHNRANTHSSLRDQFTLGGGSGFDEGLHGGRDGLGGFENLFIESQVLVDRLQRERHRPTLEMKET